VIAFSGGDFIERIVIVDAEQIPRLDAMRFQGAKNRIVNQDAAEGAHVHAPRGGLRIVDCLRSGNFCRDFFAPEHK